MLSNELVTGRRDALAVNIVTSLHEVKHCHRVLGKVVRSGPSNELMAGRRDALIKISLHEVKHYH